MISWNQIQIDGIARIEKAVAEFNVWEVEKIPHGKFKVKIYEQPDGKYLGYTNLQVKDENDSFYAAVGHGDTIEAALEDTIRYFLSLLQRKENWDEADFSYGDSSDF